MPRHARLDAPGVLHHIIIRSIDRGLIFGDNVDRDRFVERMGRACADTFDKRHGRLGRLCRNRYGSILCEEDTYLVGLVCRIHLNPIRGRLVKDVAGTREQ